MTLMVELQKKTKSRDMTYTVYHSMRAKYHHQGEPLFSDKLLTFEGFVEHVGLRPSPEHRLRRKDKSVGFQPENLEWYIAPWNQETKRKTTEDRLWEIKMAKELGISLSALD